MKAAPLMFLALSITLAACTSTTTTKVVTYDAQGDPIVTQTSTVKRNDAAEKAKEIGKDVKEGVVSGYEWTRDKTIEGYHWVKDKSVETYDSLTK